MPWMIAWWKVITKIWKIGRISFFARLAKKQFEWLFQRYLQKKAVMQITFTYKRRSYKLEAEVVALELNGQTIKSCYPIGIKSEWIIMFGKNHSPLFYTDDETPVLARYKTASGRASFFQVFIDTETKQIVESLSIRARSGSYRLYTLQEVLPVRRADKVLFVKS